ncbi:Killer protein [Chitinimonas arctica]|uniref:Killer protein n=1 Tax=Chitinimonas arctica TaxID=2594795 RepID=A0A516SDR4_9NEIS|nr:type II toxin-antitoxin system RelE/ParE family toxin [Chitinimonas arctica]QDQ26178.1 Killer protein [Chitinimonas arctica]
MILSFQHKGLAQFHHTGNQAGIQAAHAAKLRKLLTALDAAAAPSDLALPSFSYHPLKGNLKGYFSLTVSGNWRLIFRWQGTDVELLNYLDYH